MKKILGLDLGTNSIGWAVVNEAENAQEKSSIVKLGVRVINYDNFVSGETGKEVKGNPADFFIAGKSVTPNAARTQSRSMRRNLQRRKLRRNKLVKILKENHFISDESILCENGNNTTFETYRLRAKAVTEEVGLEDLARIFLMISKKRGYKSSRKANSSEDGQLIDGMKIAEEMIERHLTPAQYLLEMINNGKRENPDFYQSDLQNEFDLIWNKQKGFYPEILSDELKNALVGKNKTQSWGVCKEPFGIVGIKRLTKGFEQKKENLQWRVEALSQKIGLEELAIVLQEINGDISSSSGYLGKISDRSKELYFNKITVGQYLMEQLDRNPNYSLKNQVFYRQDYLDEFNAIWNKQKEFHPELSDDLKKEIGQRTIFFQRPLKSQKGLVGICELEGELKEIEVDGQKKIKKIGPKVCPKSSPLFQEFKIWQKVNDFEVNGEPIPLEEKQIIARELSVRGKMSSKDILKELYENYRDLFSNFDELDGNTTQVKLYEAYAKIIENSGHDTFDFKKMSAEESTSIVEEIFNALHFNTEILHFDSSLPTPKFEQQASFKLWHLLYSFEGDGSKTGNEKLVQKLQQEFSFDEDSAKILASVTFKEDYGSLSSKAMKKILPYLKQGYCYSDACEKAGYKHSARSLTKEELEKKTYKERLQELPKNSLRNPVVEKILNQMVHVVNGVIDTYGKPTEIRIELARELKNSAKKRENLSKINADSQKLNEKYREILQKNFGIAHPSRNDLIRYKLYRELETNGFHTLYSNTYISQDNLFTNKFDIEHIIPQSKIFDDSFANKTLESREINIEKGNKTARDFVVDKYGESGNDCSFDQFEQRVDKLHREGAISKNKRKNLLKKECELESGFINRDLKDTQYIAKKAREMLEDLVRDVVPTTGKITDKLREDWELVNVMQELNWDKYDKLDLTEWIENKEGKKIRRIKDWTKRNDHRHHAMDALTIAFTKRSYIQFLNTLNARGRDPEIDSIEKQETHGQRIFNAPFELNEFRAQAKEHLENILVSIKAKNKVVTPNINKAKNGVVTEISLPNGEKKMIKGQLTKTPRNSLHNDTIYAKRLKENLKEEKVNASLTIEKINSVINEEYKNALLKRLAENGNDSKKAFGGKNAISKNPIFLNAEKSRCVPEIVRTKSFHEIFTIRKEVSPDLKLDKVVDDRIRMILQERLTEFNNDAKAAFSNLDKNPIWQNKEKGIAIKRVAISGPSNTMPLHSKKDHFGKNIQNENGNIANDYVQLGNNHHVAVYRDENGEVQDIVVSAYEATQRNIQNKPVIDKEYNKDKGWTFLFSMKQNEFFVFANEETGFDPSKIDLMDEKNNALISPNLFRVQKFSKVGYGNSFVRDYMFRHHLESTLDENKMLRGMTYLQFKSTSFMDKMVKVRVNHIGKIVFVGEF
ncbi:CRISPR-associated endonuclease, Csn1 family [Fibrobacter sp. UWH9]|uniref:type II CRISPR RNA-guided endonuclease Cas9 n=1 Tax=Fibrobacter sp. UWH9 TaxID=1896213 RepID=UPI000910C71A|nr:type II CRISPR RNA-guided endonuclease Cas9 [Fibrobacter sp. UWH9]SHH56255.1 CRISPR-associated endonuclease, Csn1 family [Fibrobacter sp. UWH9]